MITPKMTFRNVKGILLTSKMAFGGFQLNLLTTNNPLEAFREPYSPQNALCMSSVTPKIPFEGIQKDLTNTLNAILRASVKLTHAQNGLWRASVRLTHTQNGLGRASVNLTHTQIALWRACEYVNNPPNALWRPSENPTHTQKALWRGKVNLTQLTHTQKALWRGSVNLTHPQNTLCRTLLTAKMSCSQRKCVLEAFGVASLDQKMRFGGL